MRDLTPCPGGCGRHYTPAALRRTQSRRINPGTFTAEERDALERVPDGVLYCSSCFELIRAHALLDVRRERRAMEAALAGTEGERR